MSYSPIAIRTTGSLLTLDIPEGLSFEEWREIGQDLAKAEHHINWWIGDWWRYGERAKYGEAEATAKALFPSLAYQSLRHYASVAGKFDNVCRQLHKLTFSHFQEVKDLPLKTAKRILDQAEREDLSAMQVRAEVRKLRAAERIGELVKMPLPTDAPVHILYADPPWQYENPPMGGGNRSIENQYPTMTIEELRALDVGGCALDDALLFMWATVPKLAECLTLLEPWGFTYRTNLAWDKVDIGMGYYARNQHELLLICKRGEIPPPAPELRPSSIYRETRTDHSRKPLYYYDLIESWYPALRKRELFSRNKARPGWEDPWGNEFRILEAAE